MVNLAGSYLMKSANYILTVTTVILNIKNVRVSVWIIKSF